MCGVRCAAELTLQTTQRLMEVRAAVRGALKCCGACTLARLLRLNKPPVHPCSSKRSPALPCTACMHAYSIQAAASYPACLWPDSRVPDAATSTHVAAHVPVWAAGPHCLKHEQLHCDARLLTAGYLQQSQGPRPACCLLLRRVVRNLSTVLWGMPGTSDEACGCAWPGGIRHVGSDLPFNSHHVLRRALCKPPGWDAMRDSPGGQPEGGAGATSVLCLTTGCLHS